MKALTSAGSRLRALLVLTGVALAMLLAACGGSSDEGEKAQAPERKPATIEHALGITRVPANPQRIVVTNPYSLLDYLLVLGIEPVGSLGDPAGPYPFGGWLEGRADDVKPLGGGEEIDLEAIAALKPDLILADPWREAEYPKLSKIAPTVAVPLDYTNYEKEFEFVARVVGREAEAQEIVAEHRERLDAFRAKLPDPAPVVSVARVFPSNGSVEGRSYVTTLMEAAGLRRPAAHERDADGFEFSLEQLRKIDGDVLLVYTGSIAAEQEANDKALETLQRHPLWDRLRAVRGGNAHLVDSYVWGGGGILWADAVLEDLERLLVEES